MCEKLSKEWNWAHYSAGELLRQEAATGSTLGVEISTYLTAGKIVPPELLMSLLKNSMESSQSTHVFLIDGFPRSLAQAVQFEETVVHPKAVLYLNCTKEKMLDRCLARGQDTGRADDNLTALTTRYQQFLDVTLPVLDRYSHDSSVRVIEIDATQDKDTVYHQCQSHLSDYREI